MHDHLFWLFIWFYMEKITIHQYFRYYSWSPSSLTLMCFRPSLSGKSRPGPFREDPSTSTVVYTNMFDPLLNPSRPVTVSGRGLPRFVKSAGFVKSRR